MAKDIELEIKSILGEISETNSKNEQKVVALASWNKRPDTVDIRRYNVSDEILTKGISLTSEEAGELIYILLSNPTEVKYDPERVRQILKEQEELQVDVTKLVAALSDDELSEQEQLAAYHDDSRIPYEEIEYANSRRPVYTNGLNRIVPKKNGLFTHLYK